MDGLDASSWAIWSDVLAALPSGLVLTNADHAVTFANPAAIDCLGLPKKHRGRPLSALRGEFQPMLWPTDQGELLLLSDEGSDRARVIGFTSRDLSDDNGERVGTVIICSDITNAKAKRREDSHNRRLADLGAVVATVAHEIRNPVFAITTLSGLMETEDAIADNPELLQIATRIGSEAQRIARLIDDVLGFGRDRPIERRDVNPLDLLETLIEDIALTERLREGGPVPITIHPGPGAPCHWSIDPEATRQVLSNVIRNAIRAVGERRDRLPTHGVRIRVDRQEGALEMEIEDDGIGIREEDLTKVTDPFFTRGKGGTGLGLAVALKLVRAHGGTLSIRSESGSGTNVVIRIPA